MSAPRITPEGLTLQEEGFAQSVADGISQFAAYNRNYNVRPDTPRSTVDQNASHLATKLKPRIEALIAAKQLLAIGTSAWTLDRMVSQAEKHMEVALTDHPRRGPNVSAANGALELIAKASGLLVQKVEVSGAVDHRHSLASWTVEELDALVAAKALLLASGYRPELPVVAETLESGTVVEGSVTRRDDASPPGITESATGEKEL